MDKASFPIFDTSSRSAYRDAVMRAVELLLDAIPDAPYSGATPGHLRTLLSAQPAQEEPGPDSQVDEELRRIIAHSVHTGHPLAAAHLHCPVLIPTLMAEVIVSALNQSMDSFDQAPAATIVEQNTIRWLCDEIGWTTGAGGTFTAGGTLSNYTALLLARDHYARARWNWPGRAKGLPPEARRYRLLCSEVAHFSVDKSAIELGLGTDAVVKVPVDSAFRLRIDALQRSVDEITAAGEHVVAVIATAGTTDFGSIDPLPAMAAIARQAGAWFHVDAAYGGALLFSPAYRHMLAGIELADSVAIDFHKLLWMPISCAAFLVRDEALFDPIKLQAEYLNPESHETLGIPDLVTKSVQTSRRFDALKVWLAFRSLGRRQLREMIERCLTIARDVADAISRDDAFELLLTPELTTVVFRVRAENERDADRLNDAVRHALFNAGEAVLGHTSVSGRTYLKLTLLNPAADVSTYVALLERIKARAAVSPLPGS